MQNAEELYTQAVRRLPVQERLRLAALILNGVVCVEEQETWSTEDLQDLAAASLWYAAQTNGEG